MVVKHIGPPKGEGGGGGGGRSVLGIFSLLLPTQQCRNFQTLKKKAFSFLLFLGKKIVGGRGQEIFFFLFPRENHLFIGFNFCKKKIARVKF